jgi:hypothetical protein
MNNKYLLIALIIISSCKTISTGSNVTEIQNTKYNFKYSVIPKKKYDIKTYWSMEFTSTSEQEFGRNNSKTNNGQYWTDEYSQILSSIDSNGIIEIIYNIDSIATYTIHEKKIDSTQKYGKGTVVQDKIILTESNYIESSLLEFKSKFIDWNMQAYYPKGDLSLGDTFSYIPVKTRLDSFNKSNKYSETKYIFEEVKNNKAVFKIIHTAFDSMPGKNGMNRTIAGSGNATYDLRNNYYDFHEITKTEEVVMYRDSLAPINEKIVKKNRTIISIGNK